MQIANGETNLHVPENLDLGPFKFAVVAVLYMGQSIHFPLHRVQVQVCLWHCFNFPLILASWVDYFNCDMSFLFNWDIMQCCIDWTLDLHFCLFIMQHLFAAVLDIFWHGLIPDIAKHFLIICAMFACRLYIISINVLIFSHIAFECSRQQLAFHTSHCMKHQVYLSVLCLSTFLRLYLCNFLVFQKRSWISSTSLASFKNFVSSWL